MLRELFRLMPSPDVSFKLVRRCRGSFQSAALSQKETWLHCVVRGSESPSRAKKESCTLRRIRALRRIGALRCNQKCRAQTGIFDRVDYSIIRVWLPTAEVVPIKDRNVPCRDQGLAHPKLQGACRELCNCCDRANYCWLWLDCKKRRGKPVQDFPEASATGLGFSDIISYGPIERTPNRSLHNISYVDLLIIDHQAVQPELKGHRFRLKGKISRSEFNKVLERSCDFVCARTRRRNLTRSGKTHVFSLRKILR